MKLYVKRDQFRCFQKGKIEFDDSFEWVMLASGLEKLLEGAIESIKFYEDYQKKYNEDRSKELEDWMNRTKLLEEMLNELEHTNELTWN